MLLLTLASHTYLALHLHSLSRCPGQIPEGATLLLVERERGTQEMDQCLGRVVLGGQGHGQVKMQHAPSICTGDIGVLFLPALIASHREPWASIVHGL